MEKRKEFTNVTFRVPVDEYINYKVALLREQKDGRKTPTSDLNAHIRTVIERAEQKEEYYEKGKQCSGN